jgi:hypothetical protein
LPFKRLYGYIITLAILGLIDHAARLVALLRLGNSDLYNISLLPYWLVGFHGTINETKTFAILGNKVSFLAVYLSMIFAVAVAVIVVVANIGLISLIFSADFRRLRLKEPIHWLRFIGTSIIACSATVSLVYRIASPPPDSLLYSLVIIDIIGLLIIGYSYYSPRKAIQRRTE